MEEKVHWWYRWGFDELKPYHWLALVCLALVFVSPFFALVQPAAGLLAFGVGVFMLWLIAQCVDD